MKTPNSKLQNKQAGAAMMISVIFFLFASLAIVLGLALPLAREFQSSSTLATSKQSYFTAESGVEDIIYRLKHSKQTSSTETLVLGTSSATTTLTDLGGGQKEIQTLGAVSTYSRRVDVKVTAGTGASFNYGVQVGTGGLSIPDGKVIGNVYSNGPITASSNGDNSISGTAISANSPALTADQTNGSGTPANNVTFGNATATQDIAQSFQISIDGSPLNKVQLYIKKTGSPANATVKIVSDSSGSPSTTVLASGTLSAASVATSYGWIDIAMTTNPVLVTGTTYWLVVDAATSSSNYYIIGASSGGYANGLGKIGQQGGTWNNTTPSGLDYYFSVYLGGINGSIIGSDVNNKLPVGTVSGTAQAHTVNYVSATGNIYCVSGTGNNKSCSSQSDPTYTSFPISDANIQSWEDEATAGGIINGNYSVSSPGSSIGPKKIVGNLTVSSNTTLTVTGTLWVTGNLDLTPGHLNLASSYGTNDGVIVVDGTISISSGGSANGSGTAGSYFLMITNSSSASAASITGNAGAVIIYAPNGTVTLGGGSHVKEVTAYKMVLGGNSDITYESGLANLNFSSGPSGSYSVTSWKETQ